MKQRAQSGCSDGGSGCEPGVDITARVAHRLLGFRGLPFPAAKEMREKAGAVLVERDYRDNQLLPLAPRFRAPLESVEDALSLRHVQTGRWHVVFDGGQGAH